jgi:uncharacterized membrane protein YedE/YeeE
MTRIVEFLIGLLFGLGLLISGMTDPGKVIGFLDVAGAWDPSLAFVMGGALAVSAIAFAVARQRERTLLDGAMYWPTAQGLDRRLVAGSVLFGVGWGLSGFCPGPVLVAGAAGHAPALIFTIAMLVGMLLHELTTTQPVAGEVLE